MSRIDLTDRAQSGSTSAGGEFNWEPFLWLSYLILLFVPLTWNQTAEQFRTWFYPTLLSLPLFVALYWRAYRRRWNLALIDLLPMALFGYVLIPFNPLAFTYLVYAAIFAAYALPGLLRPLLLALGFVALQAIEIVLIRQPSVPLTLVTATVFITLACINGHLRMEGNRKNAALKVSQARVRRLAAVAERARIGRDLHDLLGHTLSLIAVKGSLAQKLAVRDLSAAMREMEDITRTARESLTQVRAAVAGMQSASLEEEVTSARELLELSGMTLSCHRDPTALPGEVENVLAMVVREATTNIHRHAMAKRASIDIRTQLGAVSLLVHDDGCGGVSVRGSGLTGIQSRVDSLGGVLDVDSPAGRGTTLRVELPLDRHTEGPSTSGEPASAEPAGT